MVRKQQPNKQSKIPTLNGRKPAQQQQKKRKPQRVDAEEVQAIGNAMRNLNVSRRQQQQQLTMQGTSPSNVNLLRAKVCGMMGGCDKAGAWAVRASHPMDHAPATGSGRIPDQTSAATVDPEGRFQFTISPPAGLAAGATWDIDVWVPNVVDAAVLWRSKASSSSYGGGNNYAAVTYPAYIPGSITSDGTATLNSSLINFADNYRAAYKGVTAHLIANSLNDSGVVYAAQWAETPSQPQTTDVGSKIELPGLLYNALPDTEELLYQKQPGTITFEARKGIYLPLKFVQPTHDFVSASSAGYLAYKTGAAAVNYVCTSPGLPGVDNPYLAVTGTTNFQSGMILFRGLNGGASVQLVSKQGLEATPVANGPWAPFVEASPLYNPVAMTRQIQVAQRLPLAFPADYNDESNILKDIWGWLRGAGKAVSGMKIPFVSDIAGIVGGAVDAIEGLF